MLNNLNLYTVAATADGKKSFKGNIPTNRKQATASSSTQTTGYVVKSGLGDYGLNSANSGLTAVSKNSMVKLLDGFIVDDPQLKRALFEDIYQHDPIAGSAIDIFSSLPFSSFDLNGIEDEDVLEVYQKSCDNIKPKQLIPGISREYLTSGVFIGTSLFDKVDKIFTSIMPQDPNSCKITPIPIYGVDPIIDLQIPQAMKKILKDKDPRLQKIMRDLPQSIRNDMNQGEIKLPPETTIYMPRRTLINDWLGTSYLERMLPIHLLEKTLFRGTLDQANRRQRGILWVQAGDEEWIPPQEDLNAIRDLFQEADSDPTGAVIVTRPSINAQEVRCLAGNTLISTEHGLKRIDELVEHDPNKLKPDTAFPLNIKVKDRFGKFSPIKAWIYQGKQPVVEITTTRGYNHTLTNKHKLMVFRDGNIIPARLENITNDDYICVNTQKTEQVTSKLSLGLVNVLPERKDTKHVKLPSIMTPDLAKIIALIISDGCVRNGWAGFTNTNYDNILEFKYLIKKIFNYDVSIKTIKAKKTFVVRKYYDCKEIFVATINTKIITNALYQLGLKHVNTKKKSPAYYKVVPWSILEADRESQLSFLAGYIMGDGGILYRNNKIEIEWRSYSKNIMKNIQIILGNLGFVSYRSKHRVYLGQGEGSALYPHIQPYLNKRFGKFRLKNSKSKTYYGVPADYYIAELEKRALRRSTHRKSDPSFPIGTWFLTDDGKEIIIPGSWTELFKNQRKAGCPFSYDNYKNGLYTAHLNIIKQVSKTLYNNLIEKLELGYCYEKIVSRKDKGIKHTYDLSMKNSKDQTFTGNLLLTRNSATDFWRYDEMDQYFAAAKYRVLNISETLITGEFSVSTLDATLSVLVDNFRAYRELITSALFYDKLFPAIAIANDFKAEDYMVKSMRASQRKESGKLLHLTCNGRLRTYTVKGVNYDTGKYAIPQIEWHKHLKPEGDTAYIELLSSLGDKGLPITMGMYAAAAGLNLDSILQSMDPDIDLRKKVAKYLKQVNKINSGIQPDMLGGDDQQQAQATMLAGLISKGSAKRSVGLLGREFDDRDRLYERKKNGKYRLTSRRRVREMTEAANRKIAEALANSARKENKRIRKGKERPTKIISSPIYGIVSNKRDART